MKLSRLSNRQLRRLLAQGEVRFAFDERERQGASKTVKDYLMKVGTMFAWPTNFATKYKIVRDDPEIMKFLGKIEEGMSIVDYAAGRINYILMHKQNK